MSTSKPHIIDGFTRLGAGLESDPGDGLRCDRCGHVYPWLDGVFVQGIDGEEIDATPLDKLIPDQVRGSGDMLALGCLYCGDNAKGRVFVRNDRRGFQWSDPERITVGCVWPSKHGTPMYGYDIGNDRRAVQAAWFHEWYRPETHAENVRGMVGTSAHIVCNSCRARIVIDPKTGVGVCPCGVPVRLDIEGVVSQVGADYCALCCGPHEGPAHELDAEGKLMLDADRRPTCAGCGDRLLYHSREAGDTLCGTCAKHDGLLSSRRLEKMSDAARAGITADYTGVVRNTAAGTATYYTDGREVSERDYWESLDPEGSHAELVVFKLQRIRACATCDGPVDDKAVDGTEGPRCGSCNRHRNVETKVLALAGHHSLHRITKFGPRRFEGHEFLCSCGTALTLHDIAIVESGVITLEDVDELRKRVGVKQEVAGPPTRWGLEHGEQCCAQCAGRLHVYCLADFDEALGPNHPLRPFASQWFAVGGLGLDIKREDLDCHAIKVEVNPCDPDRVAHSLAQQIERLGRLSGRHHIHEATHDELDEAAGPVESAATNETPNDDGEHTTQTKMVRDDERRIASDHSERLRAGVEEIEKRLAGQQKKIYVQPDDLDWKDGSY